MWQNPLFEFDKQSCCAGLKVLEDQKTIKSGQDRVYQVCLMTQPLSPRGNTNTPYTFKFRINKMRGNWIAIGVAQKKIIEQTQFIL